MRKQVIVFAAVLSQLFSPPGSGAHDARVDSELRDLRPTEWVEGLEGYGSTFWVGAEADTTSGPGRTLREHLERILPVLAESTNVPFEAFAERGVGAASTYYPEERTAFFGRNGAFESNEGTVTLLDLEPALGASGLAVITGRVSAVKEGFLVQEPSSLLVVDQVEVLKTGRSDVVFGDRLFLYYPSADFEFAGTRFVKGSLGYPRRPEAGERILFFFNPNRHLDARERIFLPARDLIFVEEVKSGGIAYSGPSDGYALGGDRIDDWSFDRLLDTMRATLELEKAICALPNLPPQYEERRS